MSYTRDPFHVNILSTVLGHFLLFLFTSELNIYNDREELIHHQYEGIFILMNSPVIEVLQEGSLPFTDFKKDKRLMIVLSHPKSPVGERGVTEKLTLRVVLKDHPPSLFFHSIPFPHTVG